MEDIQKIVKRLIQEELKMVLQDGALWTAIYTWAKINSRFLFKSKKQMLLFKFLIKSCMVDRTAIEPIKEYAENIKITKKEILGLIKSLNSVGDSLEKKTQFDQRDMTILVNALKAIVN